MTVEPDDVDAAAAVLGRGGLVAFPTETVYGLGADATNATAVGRIFTVKGRPRGHPLIVHLGAADWLDDWAVGVPDVARALAAAYWPGPLTLLVARRRGVPDVITGGRPTVGLRVPGHPVALALLDRVGSGLAAPSANRFGRVSPTTAAHVRADLGDAVDMVLDGGPCTVGVESTIVDMTTDRPTILRHGGVSAAEIALVAGPRLLEVPSGPSRAPGMLESHYAPQAAVDLARDTDDAHRRADHHRAAGRTVDVLDPGVDAASYARHLYEWLRDADARHLDVLVVVPPCEEGLGAAVNERLRKAAAPRSRA